MVSQQGFDRRFMPAFMAEFDGPSMAGRQVQKKVGQPGIIAAKRGRQLEQNGP
jgi:hypothetical protein